MFEKKPMGHHFDRNTHTDIPKVTWTLHETTCVGEHLEHVMRQEKALVQLHGAGAVDHAVQRSNGCISPTSGRRARDCPNLGDEISSRIGTMKVNFEDPVKQNDADIDGSGDVANSNIGVLVEKLEKSKDGKQNHPEKEYGESVVSIFEPFIRDPPSCLKKGCFDEPLVVLDDANEQVAFWYEDKDAQEKDADPESADDYVDNDLKNSDNIDNKLKYSLYSPLHDQYSVEAVNEPILLNNASTAVDETICKVDATAVLNDVSYKGEANVIVDEDVCKIDTSLEVNEHVCEDVLVAVDEIAYEVNAPVTADERCDEFLLSRCP